ncbi:MAG: ABC transporter ATP-binding protein [Gemmatimonadota bacterium]|nr:ABC transporter ATP-binding protein [Gemmatimonadota bacterium]
MSEGAFACGGVSYGYPGSDRPVLQEVDLDIAAGRLTTLIGPNGAGKSTLVRLLSGAAAPTAGSIVFLGRPLSSWARTDMARRLAVVSQEAPLAVPQTVEEYVSLGRNPYVSAWSTLSVSDHAVVTGAVDRVGLAALARRRLTDLSGGELQRAKLARALAQEPDVLILDEPTAHLDIGHALWAFETIDELVAGGLTAICVTHDMNLASRFADDMVLLAQGRIAGSGTPATVLSVDRLSEAYQCRVQVEDHGVVGHVVLPISTDAALEVGSP